MPIERKISTEMKNRYFLNFEVLRKKKKIEKHLSKNIKKVLNYLNFLYFKLPEIIFFKKRLYNFVVVNFFKFNSNIIFNAKIFFVLGSDLVPTATIVSLFIAKKLIHRYTLGSILMKCFIYLKNFCSKSLISGFKILISGRISRRDRAIYK